jgi:RNA polymerase sigma-70 factor (ECF subfamily)
MTVREYNTTVNDHADSVYRFILKNLRDEEMAQDVVQDAFLKMWEKASDITFEKAKSYLYTTAYHTMIDLIRKRKRETGMEEVHENLHSYEHGYSDAMEILDEAVKRLPEIQRSALILRDYEGYSYQEIGDILNLNESQVKVYIYRARVALKKYIGNLETVI